MPGKPMVVGHRGWLAKYPENTLVSLRAALELGVDAIEFGLHLSRDGHLVVIHDAKLDGITNGQGPVQEKTLAELKRLDAGGWFALDPRFPFDGQRSSKSIPAQPTRVAPPFMSRTAEAFWEVMLPYYGQFLACDVFLLHPHRPWAR